MIASQLLRILQTIPRNVKHETCAFDPAEQNKIMKENHNEALPGSESFGRLLDPLDFGSKEIYKLNDSKGDFSALAFEVKGNEYWNPFVDGFSMDNTNSPKDSLDEDKSELYYPISTLEKNTIPFPTDSSNEDKVLKELLHHDESKSRHSNSDFIASSNFFEMEEKSNGDKNVWEREVSELIVSYKEVNHHIVKDICVDEGTPEREKRLDKAPKNDHFYPESPNDSATGYGHEGERNGEKIILGRPKTLSERFSDKDSDEHGDPADSVQQKAKRKHFTEDMSHSLEKSSFVDRILPIQEFGTRSFLRSFLNSVDDDRSKFAEMPDQISSDKPDAGSPVSLTGMGSKEDVLASSSLCDSEAEGGIITLNLSSSPPEMSTAAENLRDGSVVPVNPDSEYDVGSVQALCANMEDDTIENVHDNSLKIMDGHTDDSHSKNTNQENIPEQSPDFKTDEHSPEDGHTDDSHSKNTNQENIPEQSPDFITDEHSPNEKIPSVSSKSGSPMNDEGLVVEPNDPNHECRDSGGVSSVNQFTASSVSVGNNLQRDEGETSFSATGLITYSGPIAFSGSLSIRSDGSATSARSFAFPILQNEWNSSPVRMAKADRRHFRKHKGWRSGLLCCRF